MTKVAIVGCGIVGAMIAYELSQVPGLEITVFDRLASIAPDLTVCPSSTGAALGVLMGAISKKTKGNNLRMRLLSLQYYETLIPKLAAQTGRVIPFNRQGILMLQFTEDDLAVWQRLVEIRQTQGWQLEIWDSDRLQTDFPHLNLDRVTAGIYSPQDRQVHPVQLTQALIAAAQQNGVCFQFETDVVEVESTSTLDSIKQCQTVQTTRGEIATDWLIIAAGLGSTPLTQSLGQPISLQPVLGQAIQLRLNEPLANRALQPVITGNDVHLVPLGDNEYWVGATVEFPADLTDPQPNPEDFAALKQQAIALCPRLATATPLRTWHGLRPRPQSRPAPIIDPLSGYSNVLLATGHYRNGVLLAPATAVQVREAIETSSVRD